MSSVSKQIRTAALLFVLTIFLAGSAWSFNGQRKGFILGGGLGPGLTIDNGDNYLHFFNTDFRIGAGISNQFQLYWSTKVSWYRPEAESWYRTGSETKTFGVAGAGISYYFAPTAPCGYATASIGYSGTHYPFEHYDHDEHHGFGLSMGFGYEFAPHWSLEGTLVGGIIDYGGYNAAVWSFKVTLIVLAY